MAKAKELARQIVDGVELTTFDNENEYGTDVPQEYYIANESKFAENVEQVVRSLLKELYTLTKNGRPAYSALTEILNKAESIAARANKLFGRDIVTPKFFLNFIVSDYPQPKEICKSILEDKYEEILIAVTRHQDYLEAKNRSKDVERKMSFLDNFAPYQVTPFEELIDDENALTKEILCCLAAIGQYSQVFPLEWFRPLVNRTNFLMVVKNKYGTLSQELVDRYERDPIGTIRELGGPI